MVSISSTTSPIPAGQWKAGTHNSSMAQRSWRRSLYLLMIHSGGVDEMEFQCCLAQFVISNKGVMRCKLAANLNGGMRANIIHLGKQWEQLPGEKKSAKKGSVVRKRGVTQKVLEKRVMKKKSTESNRRSTERGAVKEYVMKLGSSEKRGGG